MGRIKFILTIVAVAVVLLALAAALFWRQLLSPEQKLRYGLVFEAAEDLRQSAASGSDGADLDVYVDALVSAGNFGRATYLTDLHGAGSERIEAVRSAVAESLRSSVTNKVYAVTDDPALVDLMEQPAGQSLRYLEGYRHALLGDWSSARNFFAAIEPAKLAPALRPYHQYYLARSYRLGGDEKQKAEALDLFDDLLGSAPGAGLKARAAYNLIAYYVDAAGRGGRLDARATTLLGQVAEMYDQGKDTPARQDIRWALQKSHGELAQYYWDGNDGADAWLHAAAAVELEPLNRAAEAPVQLCTLLLEALPDGQRASGQQLTGLRSSDGKLALKITPGQLPAVAAAAADFGLAAQLLKGLGRLKGELEDSLQGDRLLAQAICLRSTGEVAALRGLAASAEVRALPDAKRSEILFEEASLLLFREQWNESMARYRESAELGGPRAGEAWYGCYAILKEVQEPLNLESAGQYLRSVYAKHPESPAVAKAIEEHLPLLVWRSPADARKLARQVMDGGFAADLPGRGPTWEASLRAVAGFWLGYMEEQKPAAESSAGHAWGYYDLQAHYPPQLESAGVPALLSEPESAAEYLAGLGLNVEAAEAARDAGHEVSGVALYSDLIYGKALRPLSALQFNATEKLESGDVAAAGDASLMRRVLELAYPMPYREEVEAAAARQGVDPALCFAVMKKESNFKEKSTSGVGAKGLMQLMPSTARFLIQTRDLPEDYMQRLEEPAVNVELGAAYLASVQTQLAGIAAPAGPEWTHAGLDEDRAALVRAMLHSYNGGPGNYTKWRGNYPGADAVLLADLVPNEENEGFAKRVWKYYMIYRWLEKPEAAGAD